MAIFIPKSWVKPFGKMSIFDFLNFIFFIAQKGVLSLLNMIKDIFLAYIAQKKELVKWPYLDQNHGLTPLEKCQFLDFLNFMFLQPRKAIFVLEYHKRHFLGLYCLKKKVGKMAIFIPKSRFNHFGKMSIFPLFELYVFITQKIVFFVLDYH